MSEPNITIIYPPTLAITSHYSHTRHKGGSLDVVGPLVFLTQRLLVLQITVAISAVPHLDEHQSCEGEGDQLERHGCDEKSPSPQLKLALLCAGCTAVPASANTPPTTRTQ